MKIVLTTILIGLLATSMAYSHEHYEHNNSHEHAMGKMAMHEGEEDLGVCPVLGGKAGKEYSYNYKGKTYNFCCSSCIEEFKKNPEKYISKIKDVDLEAFQFGFSPEVITVKKGDIVKLYVHSRDVTHGIYIKEYNINVPVKKDDPKKIEFLADKAGSFDIVCSVYCGSGHSGMKAKLVVKE
ncbi:MAG: YHS domain-containing protein [Candidatus Omnitrophica bacterium]|nr:YHS domain-containing protein [Candidatus Omnitrophota bacterium]MBU4488111.1 YHS domain-containing protein [Candidatus Omnitrophota bacterium]MCG2705218.1 YHS domain-containing protein [Candidatus Omnitrophota bacterium]